MVKKIVKEEPLKEEKVLNERIIESLNRVKSEESESD